MTKDEALSMALEALEPLVRRAAPWGELDWLNGCKAITAIKEALAEPARSMKVEGPLHVVCQCNKCNTQPEQEPVVWMYQDKSTHEVRFQKHMRGFVDHGATYETPLYTSPPQQELVCVCGAVWEGQELIYTTPQRKPLTRQQCLHLDVHPLMTIEQIVCVVEAEHGIKGKQ